MRSSAEVWRWVSAVWSGGVSVEVRVIRRSCRSPVPEPVVEGLLPLHQARHQRRPTLPTRWPGPNRSAGAACTRISTFWPSSARVMIRPASARVVRRRDDDQSAGMRLARPTGPHVSASSAVVLTSAGQAHDRARWHAQFPPAPVGAQSTFSSVRTPRRISASRAWSSGDCVHQHRRRPSCRVDIRRSELAAFLTHEDDDRIRRGKPVRPHQRLSDRGQQWPVRHDRGQDRIGQQPRG